MTSFNRFVLLLSLVISSCSNEQTEEKGESIRDTVYANAHHLQNREYYEHRRTVIKIANMDGSYVDFKIGHTDTVKVEVANFKHYPTQLRNTKNVDWTPLKDGLYILTPTDSMFYVEIWQNYDSANVVLKYFDSSGLAHTSNYDGWRIVGKSEFEAE